MNTHGINGKTELAESLRAISARQGWAIIRYADPGRCGEATLTTIPCSVSATWSF